MDNNKDKKNTITKSQKKSEKNENNNAKQKKNKKKKNKFLTILKWTIIVIVILGVIGGGTGAYIAYNWIQDAPELDMSKFQYIEPSYIVDKNGDFYQELQGKEKREVVSIDEIPEMVQLAFISIEDERFYKHPGVDIQGIAQAAIQNIKSGDITGAGGSTITQQLIKLTHLKPEKAFKRKTIEVYLALQLERVLTKEQILEAYLNKINLSQAWGIQAASDTYFRKDVSELSLAQAAVLASIIKAPTAYKPYVIEEKEDGSYGLAYTEDGKLVYSEKNQTRAINVLNKMLELGHISKEEHGIAKEQLKNNEIGLMPPKDTQIYSYFTDALYDQVLRDLMESEEYGFQDRSEAEFYMLNSGLKIYSTIDPDVQSVLDKKFKDNSLFPKQSYSARKASEAKTKELGEEVNYTPEGAMVIIDNSNAQVVGMIGGRDKEQSRSLNRATQKFQVGSSTKPLTVYGPGLETKTITLGTAFDDVAIKIGSWKPKNAIKFSGMMTTVREGLRLSLNTIAIQSWHQVGLENSVKYADLLGLDLVKEGSINDMNPAALSLGGYSQGQTPLVMASAFSTFPNEGVRTEPILYTKIEDNNGNIILENKQEKIRVFSEQTTYLITDVLKDAVRGGTTYASVPGQEVAAKTGTTDSQMHAWFCGYTPYYTAAVWYGYDENKVVANGRTYNLNIGIYGGSKPGPSSMWQTVMREIHKDLPNKRLPGKPSGLQTAEIDRISGKLPTELTEKDPRGSTVISEMFIKGTVPTETDNYHVEVTIDVSTGKIATEYCPEELVQTVVRVRKAEDRFPKGVLPLDPDFLPTKWASIYAPAEDDLCTLHNPEAVKSIEICKDGVPIDNLSLDKDQTVELQIRGVNHNNQYIDNLNDVVLTSDNDSIKIESSNKGPTYFNITGFNAGSTNITAALNYKYTLQIGEEKEEFTYTITDSILTTVNLPDLPPEITLKGNNPLIIVKGTNYNEPGATIIDDIDGTFNIPNKNISGNVNTNKVGEYTITYTYTDSGGNQAIPVERIVKVIEDNPPEISLIGDNPYYLNVGAPYNEPGATIIDDIDGTFPIPIFNISGEVKDKPGSYTIIYTYTDSGGNNTTIKRKVIVEE